MLAHQRPGAEAALGRGGDGAGRESSRCRGPGVKEGVACVRQTLSGVMEMRDILEGFKKEQGRFVNSACF